MNGKTNHASFVAWVGQPSDPNPINDILYDAGCVYYVRTTGPQTLMHLECNNNVYGRTVNPWNRNLTPGGSSGGEGALVGLRGSVWVSINQTIHAYRRSFSNSHRALVVILAEVFALLQATVAYMASSQLQNAFH
jgi:hypothetical protein